MIQKMLKTGNELDVLTSIKCFPSMNIQMQETIHKLIVYSCPTEFLKSPQIVSCLFWVDETSKKMIIGDFVLIVVCEKFCMFPRNGTRNIIVSFSRRTFCQNIFDYNPWYNWKSIVTYGYILTLLNLSRDNSETIRKTTVSITRQFSC